MTAAVKVVSARTPELIERKIVAAIADGWELSWPVQGARTVSTDGGFEATLFTATLRQVSGPADKASQTARRPDPGTTDLIAGEPLDILDQDPLLDDTVRESVWDRP